MNTQLTDDQPELLDPLEPADEPILLRWEIDATGGGASPALEAAHTWREIFGRPGRPTNEDACVFQATGRTSGASVEIDLAQDDYAHLFTQLDQTDQLEETYGPTDSPEAVPHDGRPLAVLLSGRSGSGKDTAAAGLVEHHDFVRHALADPLKAQLLALDPEVYISISQSNQSMDDQTDSVIDHRPGLFPLSRIVDAVGMDAAKQLPAVRGMLQRLGTEAGRLFFGDDDLWNRMLVQQVRGSDHTGPVVVTDVRWPHEADYLREHLGSTHRVVHLHLVRPGLDASLSGSTAQHASEAHLETLREMAQAVITNDQDTRTLISRVFQQLHLTDEN